ncbi:MAG: hypothetical protein HY606_14465 [Planctomycetes bacterium]|nr:hypothetical protein [Planctomycetota bacterium]
MTAEISNRITLCMLILGILLSAPLYSAVRENTEAVSQPQKFAYVVWRNWGEVLLNEVWVAQPGKKAPEYVKSYLGDADVSWLPKGNKFFVKTEVHFGWSSLSTTRVWVLDADGSESVINFPPGYDILYFGVSPDGTNLVFCGHNRKSSYSSADSGVWVCDIKGNKS